MQKIIIFFLLFITSLSYAVPPARYNIYRPIKKKEAEGIGVEFKGPVKIVDDPDEKDEKGNPIKKMYIWVNGCRDVEIKDPEAFKKLKNGSWVAIKLEINSCSVSGWRVF